MKIGLVSDSHGDRANLQKAIEQMGAVDIIFHMGDYTEDAAAIRHWVNIPVVSVKGNMDEFGPDGEMEVVTNVGDKKAMACHGHRYHVKNEYNTLRYHALEAGVDMVFFGHTHIPMIDQSEELLMINPGSCALPHIGGKKTYGVVTIAEDGAVSAEICDLK